MAIKIDKETCVGCGACVEVCPVNVIEMVDGKADPVRNEDCTSCGACVDACPVSAIEIVG